MLKTLAIVSTFSLSQLTLAVDETELVPKQFDYRAPTELFLCLYGPTEVAKIVPPELSNVIMLTYAHLFNNMAFERAIVISIAAENRNSLGGVWKLFEEKLKFDVDVNRSSLSSFAMKLKNAENSRQEILKSEKWDAARAINVYALKTAFDKIPMKLVSLNKVGLLPQGWEKNKDEIVNKLNDDSSRQSSKILLNLSGEVDKIMQAGVLFRMEKFCTERYRLTLGQFSEKPTTKIRITLTQPKT